MKKAKPEPPVDMWEKVTIAMQALGVDGTRPPDSFTRMEFAEKFKLGETASHSRLRTLVKLGKVQKCGSTGRNVYYRTI